MLANACAPLMIVFKQRTKTKDAQIGVKIKYVDAAHSDFDIFADLLRRSRAEPEKKEH